MKFRKLIWIISGYLKKHSRVLIISLVIGIIVFTNLQRILAFVPKPKPTYYIGRVGSVSFNQIPTDIQQLVGSGLTQIDSSSTVSPSIASSWSIEENGQQYSFTINPQAQFSDQSPVTNQDINYNFKDVVVERPQDNLIIFKLPEPFSPFLSAVSQPILKQEKQKVFLLFKKTIIIGTNDFVITKLKTKAGNITSLTLESTAEKKIYRFYPTQEAAIQAYKLGLVDQLEELSEPKDLINWKNTMISPEPRLDQYVAIFFNTADPNLADKSTRQALAYAISDKNFSYQRAISPIHPLSWAYNPQVKPYEYDLKSAQELLKTEAENAPQTSLELTTTPTYLDIAEKIKVDWEKLGLMVNIKVNNFPDTGNFQVLLIGQQIPPDPDQYTLWHSTQSTNLTRYQSPKVDKLLEDGRKTINQNERKTIYQDFQRFLLEDSPAVFLFHRPSFTVKRS